MTSLKKRLRSLFNDGTDGATNDVSDVTDDVGMTSLHLSPNVITLTTLLHLREVITFRSSTSFGSAEKMHPNFFKIEIENLTLEWDKTILSVSVNYLKIQNVTD